MATIKFPYIPAVYHSDLNRHSKTRKLKEGLYLNWKLRKFINDAKKKLLKAKCMAIGQILFIENANAACQTPSDPKSAKTIFECIRSQWPPPPTFPPSSSFKVKLSTGATYYIWKASGTSFSCDKFRLPHLINLLLCFGSITIPFLEAPRQLDLARRIVSK